MSLYDNNDPQVSLSRPELLTLLRQAHDEIVTLRRQVNELTPRARAYDDISLILGFIPRQSQGYGIDVAWRVQEAVAEVEKIREQEKQQ